MVAQVLKKLKWEAWQSLGDMDRDAAMQLCVMLCSDRTHVSTVSF